MATISRKETKHWTVRLFSFWVVYSFLTIGPVLAGGTFALSPASGTYIRGCTQAVDIAINVVSGQSNAADAILTYDTSKIEIIDALPSIPGIQILPGNAYESYAGNSVNTTTGEIKLVGYSSTSTLQVAATFATIYFKAKPIASNGALIFTFTGSNPYTTLDSNIADATTAYDMLTGVTNGAYTFTAGSCISDTTPPTIAFVSPTHLASNVAPNATVTIKVSDTGAGISLPTLQVAINGVVYTSSSPELSAAGSPASYTITITPNTPFPTNAPSVISVSIEDMAGNKKNANISVNTGYSCPSPQTLSPPSVACPTSPPSTPQPESPIITINSPLAVSVQKPYELSIDTSDLDGIAPESFSFSIGKKIFTLAGTPDRISVSGSKNRYTFILTLQPTEFDVTSEGKIVGTVRITDLKGNTRIQTIIFEAVGKPTTGTITPIANTLRARIAEFILFIIIPFVAAPYLIYYLLFTMQPVLLDIRHANGRQVRFPQAFLLYSNGTRHALHGSFTGKIHGRVPHETVTIVVQKYGYASVSVQVTPSVAREVKRVVLTRL
jgi:hypothetical protein